MSDGAADAWIAVWAFAVTHVTPRILGAHQSGLLQSVSFKSLIIKKFSPDYESEGRAFESLRVRHFFQTIRL